MCLFFFFKQKTAYEMRISDWSSDVCSSDLTIVPDSEARGLLAMLPAAFRPYVSLARFDRPIGWWLLFWPGAWAVALAGGAIERWDLILWLLIGSIAMRGAGCVYNDIVDRDQIGRAHV